MGLINEPRLIFLDEPTSGLDVQSNLIIRDVIRDLNARGVTVFLTTHNIEEANLTCDRVAIINRGMIAAIDSPEKLKRHYPERPVGRGCARPGPAHAEDGLRGIATVSEVRKLGDKFRAHHRRPPGRYRRGHGICKGAERPGDQRQHVRPEPGRRFIKLTGLEVRHQRGEDR